MGIQPVPDAASCTLTGLLSHPWVMKSQLSQTLTPDQEGAKVQWCACASGALGEAVDQMCCDWSGGLYQLETRARGRALWACKRVHPEAAVRGKLGRVLGHMSRSETESTELSQDHLIREFAFCGFSYPGQSQSENIK